MKNWIIALVATAGFAAGGPAQAERMLNNWSDAAQPAKLAMNDTLMHKQLCSTDVSDASCTDTDPTAKDLLLAADPKSDDPPSSNPIRESPPNGVTPTVIAVPEPTNLLALALGVALLFGLRGRGRPS